MIDPQCCDNAERDPWPHVSDEYVGGGLSALDWCARHTHAGLEFWGSLRALLAVGALVLVAVAWRRRP